MCGIVLEPKDGSHVFRCPERWVGENRFAVQNIDQDLSAASIIAVCGTGQLGALPRPDFLWGKQDKPGAHFKF